jgi:hypothetical protein
MDTDFRLGGECPLCGGFRVVFTCVECWEKYDFDRATEGMNGDEVREYVVYLTRKLKLEQI